MTVAHERTDESLIPHHLLQIIICPSKRVIAKNLRVEVLRILAIHCKTSIICLTLCLTVNQARVDGEKRKASGFPLMRWRSSKIFFERPLAIPPSVFTNLLSTILANQQPLNFGNFLQIDFQIKPWHAFVVVCLTMRWKETNLVIIGIYLKFLYKMHLVQTQVVVQFRVYVARVPCTARGSTHLMVIWNNTVVVRYAVRRNKKINFIISIVI